MYPTLARAPLPDFDFTDEEQREVYLPDEDSFLLMDAARTFLERNPDFQPRSVLEVGPGSGVVITSVLQTLKELGRPAEQYGAFDQSRLAVEMTRRTLRRAGFAENCVQGELERVPRKVGNSRVSEANSSKNKISG